MQNTCIIPLKIPLDAQYMYYACKCNITTINTCTCKSTHIMYMGCMCICNTIMSVCDWFIGPLLDLSLSWAVAVALAIATRLLGTLSELLLDNWKSKGEEIKGMQYM